MNYEQAVKTAVLCAHQRIQSPGRLNGKIAFVTGAAQGIGAGISVAMHREGATVFLTDLPSKKAKAEAMIRENRMERAAFYPCDVTAEDEVRDAVIACVDSFGGIDIAVANAGVTLPGSITEVSTDAFRHLFDVNFEGYYFLAKYAAPVMLVQNDCNRESFCDIIQINSKSGLTGSNLNFAYASSKFAGIGLTQSLALELAPFRIKVNAICPGNYYEGAHWGDPTTGLLQRFLAVGKVPGAKTAEDVKNAYLAKQPINSRGCNPADIAKAVIYCVEQTFETGQAIPVTGGQIMLA